MPDVKFCGLTLERDALEAARLGARYAGVILTRSRRRVSTDQASRIGDVVRDAGVKLVGVFGDEGDAEIMADAKAAAVDVVQLHGRGATAPLVRSLKDRLGVAVWEVVRVGDGGIAPTTGMVEGDGLLLDTLSSSALGGTGVAFDWASMAATAGTLRQGRILIVAGGLTPENVGGAIAHLAPDVVDVSSGVEVSPGVKDHLRMRAFMAAVQAATSPVLP